MGLSTAERNRRKRERKKREKEQQRKLEEESKLKQEEKTEDGVEADVEIEYIPERILPPAGAEFEALRRFQERATAAVVTDDERHGIDDEKEKGHEDGDEDDEDGVPVSKRKLREMLRPSVAELKQKVNRPDLVEAHDVTAEDPEFLIKLKSVPGTVPVPRHWGRKRKYLQGKRGFEKPPFQLPDFIIKTGITEIRDTVATEEANMSVRQKNRMKVAPKMGAIDVDYRTLHDAFFKHQTKPSNLTKFGDIYYEGKELETKATSMKPGHPLSRALRDALGMTTESAPPPWLINMQRYGPPPSWPGIPIPGLNAPLPNSDCQYGFHPGGWGKPPVDNYGRPLYGGNPFDPPGSKFKSDMAELSTLVTSDGKTLTKTSWGVLPSGYFDESEDEEESSDEEMDESSSEEEEDGAVRENADGMESVLPPPPPMAAAVAPASLRKDASGDETPMVSSQPKQLYQVIEQKKTTMDQGAVFASEVAYVVPGAQPSAASVPEGAESVLSKAVPSQMSSKGKGKDDEDEEDLGKNFKF